MDITITGKRIDITDPIREYAEGKVAKLYRYYDRITSIDVLADRSNHGQAVEVELEVIVHVAKSDPFVVKVESNDLYACIDEAVDKLERLLTDHKEKLRKRKHTSPRPE